MTVTDEHSVTQSVKAIFKKHGMIKTALAFAKAYWPALSIVATVIVAGTISVMKIDEILAGYKAQAILNQHFADAIMHLDGRLDASLQAINQKVDAVAKSEGETATKLHSLFEDERVTVTITPKVAPSPPSVSQKKKRP